jgi:hypothetical protein
MLRLIAACVISAAIASTATALFLRHSATTAPRSPATVTPRAAVAVVYRKWQLQTESLAAQARSRPGRTVFRNPPRSALRARLRAAAARYGFRVRRLTVLRPRGEAPVIVVQTDRPCRFARALSEVIEAIAPTGHISAATRDPAYEALYLEALDGRGVPFVAAYRRWRGEWPGGGAWARSSDILPPSIPPPISQD